MNDKINLLWAFIAIFFMSSCDEDWDPDELLMSPTGNLDFTELTINVPNDINTDEFIIQISSADSMIKWWKKNELPQTMSLNIGTYIVTVTSATSQSPGWDAPVYIGNTTITIKEEETTYIQALSCEIASVGVMLQYSEDLYRHTAEGATVTIYAGYNDSLVYNITETRSGYFVLPENSSTIVAKFSGNVNNREISQQRIFTDITAGDNIIVDYTVDNLINPTTPPTITSETLSTTNINTINEDINASVEINSPYGIENIEVEIISDLITNDYLQSIELASKFDLANPNDLEQTLNNFGLPTGNAITGQTKLNINLTELLSTFATIYGIHQIGLTVTDVFGLSSSQTYTFEAKAPIDPAKAPTITSETLNLDGTNIITSDIIAKVDIKAPYGIENFEVKIISAQLTKEELIGVGLDSEFDLANPGDLEPALNDLGFPTGDAVKGKTEMTFDITIFMELLAYFEGIHQFQLTITDVQGLTVTKTLTFEAPKL